MKSEQKDTSVRSVATSRRGKKRTGARALSVASFPSTSTPSVKKTLKRCVARDPLMYGSEECKYDAMDFGDLCHKHQRLITPHQLIDGVFYVGEGEDDEPH